MVWLSRSHVSVEESYEEVAHVLPRIVRVGLGVRGVHEEKVKNVRHLVADVVQDVLNEALSIVVVSDSRVNYEQIRRLGIGERSDAVPSDSVYLLYELVEIGHSSGLVLLLKIGNRVQDVCLGCRSVSGAEVVRLLRL